MAKYTVNALLEMLAAERRRADQLAVALRVLATHAQDSDGALPPMHIADSAHIAKMLRENAA